MKTLAKVKRIVLMLLITSSFCTAVWGQQKRFIDGVLKHSLSREAVPYATIVLMKEADSSFVTGTVSNLDGRFHIGTVSKGKFIIRVTHMSYKPVGLQISLTDSINHAGTILLRERSLAMDELVVVGERTRAKTEGDKTTFFMNKKMYKATTTGDDVLKLIPGIQIDFVQNLSLAGGRNIMILVDGKERDLDFVRQLDAGNIDKVEIKDNPGSDYDAEVNGVINILLKEKDSGISGRIHAEVPTSSSEVYIFPDYSLQYGDGKFNLNTSYTGEVSNFNIVEAGNRTYKTLTGIRKVQSIQHVRQNNWSHRFHCGIDLDMNEKNHFKLNGFFNPYSQEHDGKVEFWDKGSKVSDRYWAAEKDDTDRNLLSLYSVYYKHLFDDGHEVSFDLAYHKLKAVNTTRYMSDSIMGAFPDQIATTMKPRSNKAFFKLDYDFSVSEKWNIQTGVKSTFQLLRDDGNDELQYNERILAAYAQTSFACNGFGLDLGMRAEKSVSTSAKNRIDDDVFAFMPNATISYRFETGKHLRLGFRRYMRRPRFYQLNPGVLTDGPFAIQTGNPNLKPEFHREITLDYSLRVNNNYLSTQIFIDRGSNLISKLSFINGSGVFEAQTHNLGDRIQYGMQMTGSFRLFNLISLNPYIRLFETNTRPNSVADSYSIEDKERLAYESGISAFMTMPGDIITSLRCQYNSPQPDMQSVSFSDALYFVSLKRDFGKDWKIGITSGVPFSRSFTYHGKEIQARDLYHHREGNIKLSAIPVWLKFSYRFSSGKKMDPVSYTQKDVPGRRKKGF